MQRVTLRFMIDSRDLRRRRCSRIQFRYFICLCSNRLPGEIKIDIYSRIPALKYSIIKITPRYTYIVPYVPTYQQWTVVRH